MHLDRWMCLEKAKQKSNKNLINVLKYLCFWLPCNSQLDRSERWKRAINLCLHFISFILQWSPFGTRIWAVLIRCWFHIPQANQLWLDALPRNHQLRPMFKCQFLPDFPSEHFFLSSIEMSIHSRNSRAMNIVAPSHEHISLLKAYFIWLHLPFPST